MMSKYLKLLLVAALLAIALALRIVQADGVSNLAHWAGHVGLDLPANLRDPAADAIISGLMLLVLSLLIFWMTFRPVAGATPPLRTTAPLIPDWSIAGLFIHLDPDLASATDIEQQAALTGPAVLGKLMSGELKAWGRSAGERQLVAIDPGFWQRASFTYWFLPDTPRARDLVHATLPRAAEQFHDIHVNHAQAVRVFDQGV